MRYRVHWIHFDGRFVPIVLQSQNGPCPVIAVCNALFLQSRIALAPTTRDVSFEQLIGLLQRFLQNQVEALCAKERDEMRIANALKAHEDTLRLLPVLEKGLDINVIFAGPSRFEFTPAVGLFDEFGLRLLHGWCYDPADSVTAQVLGSSSYNEVIDYLVTDKNDAKAASPVRSPSKSIESKTATLQSVQTRRKESVERPPAYNPELLSSSPNRRVTTESISVTTASMASLTISAAVPAKAPSKVPAVSEAQIEKKKRVMQAWLDRSAGQLTHHGLALITQVLKERELCVFFRNNHFATLYKLEGKLYTLVTDEGMLREAPYIGWNSVDVKGDEQYYDHFFRIPTATSMQEYRERVTKAESALVAGQVPPPVSSYPPAVNASDPYGSLQPSQNYQHQYQRQQAHMAQQQFTPAVSGVASYPPPNTVVYPGPATYPVTAGKPVAAAQPASSSRSSRMRRMVNGSHTSEADCIIS